MDGQPPFELDDTDRKLVALLREDARMPAGDIAKALGISRPTANKRLDRLLQGGLVHLLAETDIRASGREFLVLVGVSVESRSVPEVAEEFALLDETLAVQTVTGRFNIEVVIAADNQQHLNHLLTVVIPSIRGVAARAPGLCLEVVKFASNEIPVLP